MSSNTTLSLPGVCKQEPRVAACHLNTFFCVVNFHLLLSFQEEWLTCQRNWLYLESIFLAPDIKRQLPAESKMFTQVDKSWREIMSKVNKMPNALKAATQPGGYTTEGKNNRQEDMFMQRQAIVNLLSLVNLFYPTQIC